MKLETLKVSEPLQQIEIENYGIGDKTCSRLDGEKL